MTKWRCYANAAYNITLTWLSIIDT